MLEVIVPRLPEQMRGFAESLVAFGGEQFSEDPRTFTFDALQFTMRPVASHVLRLLGNRFPVALALVLDERMLLQWCAGRAPQDVLDTFSLFLTELAKHTQYGIAIERSSGSSTSAVDLSAERVFRFVDHLVRDPEPPGLTLITVERSPE